MSKEPGTMPSEPVTKEQEELAVHDETYQKALSVATRQRDHTNYSLGVLLTLIEVSMGETVQSRALKQSIRREVFALMDRNQQEVYVTFGQQDRYNAPSEIHIELTDN